MKIVIENQNQKAKATLKEEKELLQEMESFKRFVRSIMGIPSQADKDRALSQQYDKAITARSNLEREISKLRKSSRNVSGPGKQSADMRLQNLERKKGANDRKIKKLGDLHKKLVPDKESDAQDIETLEALYAQEEQIKAEIAEIQKSLPVDDFGDDFEDGFSRAPTEELQEGPFDWYQKRSAKKRKEKAEKKKEKAQGAASEEALQKAKARWIKDKFWELRKEYPDSPQRAVIKMAQDQWKSLGRRLQVGLTGNEKDQEDDFDQWDAETAHDAADIDAELPEKGNSKRAKEVKIRQLNRKLKDVQAKIEKIEAKSREKEEHTPEEASGEEASDGGVPGAWGETKEVLELFSKRGRDGDTDRHKTLTKITNLAKSLGANTARIKAYTTWAKDTELSGIKWGKTGRPLEEDTDEPSEVDTDEANDENSDDEKVEDVTNQPPADDGSKAKTSDISENKIRIRIQKARKAQSQ